jgi:hypothetical protein
MTTRNFSVKNGLTVGVANIDATTGNILTTGLANVGSLVVTGVSNLGPVSNVTITGGSSGYYLQTNGSGGLTWAAVPSGSGISNGTSNVNIPVASGNIVMGVGGAAVANFTTTGLNVFGTLNSTGNANVGNLGTAQVLATANITSPQLISNIATGTAPLIVTSTTRVANLNVATSGVANTVNDASQPNITSVGTLTSLAVTGNTTVGNLIGPHANGNSNVNIPSANGNINLTATGNTTLVVTGTGANITGTLNATGNANVGNIGANNAVFTGTLNVTGNANIGNVGTAQVLASANVTAPQLISNIATGTAPLVVTSNTVVTNLNADLLDGLNTATSATASTVVARDTNGNVSANFFIGNGSQLTGITASQVSGIANGTSNVNIPASGGNVNTSVGGTPNVLVVTATGVNVAGTLNASGNANVGNLGTGGLISATGNVSGGNLTTTGVLTVSGTGVSSIAGNLNMNNQNINNVAIPILSTDAASKFYVDNNVASGIDVHPSVAADSQTNLSATYVDGGTTPTWTTITTGDTIATGSAHGLAVNDVIVFGSTTNGITAGTAYFVAAVPTSTTIKITTTWSGAPITTLTNGTGLSITSRANSGVGATLTSTTNGTLTLNTYTLALNDRVLINGQTSGAQNGAYVVTQAGSGSLPWILTRASDANKFILNSANGLDAGAYFLVTKGTDAGSAYVLSTTGTIIIGTTSLTWAQFAQVQVYTAGTGLGLYANNQFYIQNTAVTPATYGNGDAVATFTVNAQGQITAASNTSITANAANLTGTTLSSTVVNSSLTSVGTLGSLSVTGNATAGNFVGRLANGNSNVNIPAAAGNVNLSVNGTANVLVVTATGANIAGTLNATGNANVGNIGAAAGVFSGNVTAGNANVTGQLISTIATGTAPLVVTSTTLVANLNANVLQGNAPATAATANSITQRDTNGNITANFFIGNGSQLTGITATQVSGIANGTSNINIPASGGNVNTSVAGNANILVVTGTGVNVAGTLNATGNANVGNLGTGGLISATGNVSGGNITTAGQLVSTISTGTSPLSVTSTTVVTNLNANLLNGATTATAATASTIALRDANANITANFFIGNGSQLTGITATQVSGIANGTSNINIPTSGGNVNTSVGGTANVLVVTSTGVNVAGTLNTGTGNANVGNLGFGSGIITGSGNVIAGNVYANTGTIGASLLTGTLTTAAQPNITSLGTLSSLAVSGNITTGNIALNGGLTSNRANVSISAANTVIDQFAPSTFRTAKYVISANGTLGASAAYQSAEVLLVHDTSTNAYITIYGSVCSNAVSDLVDLSANINGVSGNVTLYASNIGTSVTLKLVAAYIQI